ncbi:MAG TPA: hypothetical protein VK102_06015 [Sphingobacterium sp.]|nr:hypothetical protein [Sphingobacterium sp.]
MYKYKVIWLLIGFFILSCKKEHFSNENEFLKSEKAWLSFQETSQNSYRYTTTGSSWSGASWETTLTIKKGKVIHRKFRFTHEEGLENIPENEREWEEKESELGIHNNSSAAPVRTLDKIYDLSKNVWLKKRKDVTNYFETENEGMISLCGYVEKSCQDDCFIGVRISNIEPMN